MLPNIIAPSLLARFTVIVPASSDCCSYWMPRLILMESWVKFRVLTSVQATWSCGTSS